jgi:hypothetical protein
MKRISIFIASLILGISVSIIITELVRKLFVSSLMILIVPTAIITGVTVFFVSYNKLANKQTFKESIVTMLNFLNMIKPLILLWIAIVLSVSMLYSDIYSKRLTNEYVHNINKEISIIGINVDEIKDKVFNIWLDTRFKDKK